MCRLLVPLALILTLTAGCGSVKSVRVADTDAISASRMNRTMNGRLARVFPADGSGIYAVDVEVGVDSTTWLDPATSEVRSLATGDVRKITIVRAGQGALVGLAVGIVLGAAAGAVRAKIEGDDAPGNSVSLTGDEKMVIFPPAHALYASLGTTPIGAIVGRKHTFRLIHE